ncbi:MAG TPA: DUF5683 domain-containing protein [Longimicrobiales bacterium]|nr:DUF5683 domain-containing protein [Longimicrobiales bacterium]
MSAGSRTTTRRRALVSRATLVAAAAVAFTSPASAQVEDTIGVPVDSVIITPTVPVATVSADTTTRMPMSPRGAFIRSMILPGWGQSAFESYFRGGVFFAGWAGNWFMNFKNAVRLDEARSMFDRRRDELREALLAINPDSMAEVLETTDLLEATIRADDVGNHLRKLVRAREQQREDWIAWTVFWILASGVDGYVTAHLSDFPAAVDIEPNRDGSVSLRLQFPLGRRKP